MGLGLGLGYEIWDCDGLTDGTWGWHVGLALGFGIGIGMRDTGLACGIGNEVWDWDWGWDAGSGYTGTGQTWQRYGNDMGWSWDRIWIWDGIGMIMGWDRYMEWIWGGHGMDAGIWIREGCGMEMDMGHGVQDGDRIWDVRVWMWDGFRMGYGIG